MTYGSKIARPAGFLKSEAQFLDVMNELTGLSPPIRDRGFKLVNGGFYEPPPDYRSFAA
jgi:hypothetical protein